MKLQIVIAGIGGQGVLFAANIFIRLAQQRGLPMLGSETHGMSQRGGSVTAHIKIGDFKSPLIGEGNADILMSFDAAEAHRNLAFLRPANRDGGAFCIVNVTGGGIFPNPKVAEELCRLGTRIHTCNADQEATNIGNIRAANLVFLGFSANLPDFPFSAAEIADAVSSISPPNQKKANREAFSAGQALQDLFVI
jgi:indolepyruvate ferredoxin oxidoreductase beta subunit